MQEFQNCIRFVFEKAPILSEIPSMGTLLAKKVGVKSAIFRKSAQGALLEIPGISNGVANMYVIFIAGKNV